MYNYKVRGIGVFEDKTQSLTRNKKRGNKNHSHLMIGFVLYLKKFTLRVSTLLIISSPTVAITIATVVGVRLRISIGVAKDTSDNFILNKRRSRRVPYPIFTIFSPFSLR